MANTILVSGAGSGIGRAVAVRMAKAGKNLILLGRTERRLTETKKLLAEPKRHQVVVADVCDAESLRQGLSQLEPGALLGVVANAGIGGENQYGPEDRWREILDTNLTGVYFLVNEALPYLRLNRKEDYRHIVIVSSVLARLGVPGYAAYCASKAGLLGLMRVWARTFASEKILVNALCPGWVETEMAREGLATFAKSKGLNLETVYQEQMEHVPLNRMSQPEEIAELIQFLVSGAQNSITGQVLDINNGAIMA